MDSDHLATMSSDPDILKRNLLEHMNDRRQDALRVALPALNANPQDPEVLLWTILAALHDEKPEQALRFVQRFQKKWMPFQAEAQLFRAIAFAQQGHLGLSAQILKQTGADALSQTIAFLPISWPWMKWLDSWLRKIERYKQREENIAARTKAADKKLPPGNSVKARNNRGEGSHQIALGQTEKKADTAGDQSERGIVAPEEQPLPRYEIRIPMKVSLPDLWETTLAQLKASENFDREAFCLRYELTQLGLLQGFDELLCLPALHGVDTYWYQLETVRKVLKQFRGRVLLADEVGLGKTIEAGMVLKEYLMRGMVERVLILVPATLVGQWCEEMETKFDVQFATSYDSLLKDKAEKFWSQPCVIASIAMARRPEHQETLARQKYDLVVVDEAHHLKNRSTANWKLVNALNKRFLLLLSATPVQNSLIELYNLLTLLKPGIFKTEKEFRASYMMSGKPRLPANRDSMRDLMRDVMIRNTRSLVDVKLPPRHATTLRLEPTEEEQSAYHKLSGLVAETHRQATTQQRLALRHLLSAAGSTTATAASAIDRYLESNDDRREWRGLQQEYAAIKLVSKEKSLIELLRRNPQEKKMVFLHHRETLQRLANLLADEGLACVRFEGNMSGPEKDLAVARFQNEVPLMICTESGGEGRNLQFCNTLINFDLPWNPMTIEQRIGRIHRIGQTREVFIFNLAVRGTLEDQVLRILDEKINMFELVVGEIDAILGEMSEAENFSDLVFAAWVETTGSEREQMFDELGERLIEAKKEYESVKALDKELFGEEFVAG